MAAASGNWLTIACLWALATLLAVVLVDSVALRGILSAPLLLFVTGDALLAALAVPMASRLERTVYAVGASIALCVAGGFLLNWVDCLTPTGWAVWLALTTIAAAFVALRRLRAAVPRASRLPSCAAFRVWHAAVLGVAAAVSLGAYALSVYDEERDRQFTYTEFWMLSEAPAAPGAVVIGIRSAETAPRLFDIEVKVDGNIVALWRSIPVTPGATWTRRLTIALGAGHSRKAEAFLYEPTAKSIYRKVSAIIPDA